MKRIIFFLCVVLTVDLYSQQAPQFSQNMFNKLANNPGFAGSTGNISASVLHRSQWMGFDGAPSTQNFSVHAEVPSIGGGLGLNIVKDAIDQFSNLGIQASYAYRTQLGIGQLGMGMSFGVFQSGLDGSELNSSQGNDPAIPQSMVDGSELDLGAGVYFNTQDMYIGFSSAHLTQPIVEWSDGQQLPLKRHYFLIAGYTYDLTPTILLHPSMYLKSDGATSQMDISTNLIYDNMWGGVSYRLDEGIVILAGMEINQDLKFGAAYDVTLMNPMGNSFELMLEYNFKIKTNKSISKYKNPRFL